MRFLLGDRVETVTGVDPTTTVLQWLRARGRTGTKEGCAEGDCGACTVVLGEPDGAGGMTYRAVNACIQFLPVLDGKQVITVEDLKGPGGALHPVQRAMVESHASQCGFCTPGFVMSLFALFHATAGKVRRDEVNDWIAGNLCRCTGYRPIVDAGLAACAGPRKDRHAAAARDTTGLIGFLSDAEDIFIGNDDRFFAAPGSLESLADLYERHPDATVVAGATDVGLWITKQLRNLPKIIHMG